VKKTHLKPGELVESVFLPFLSRPPSRGEFRKVGTRAAQAISKTMFAGALWLGRGGIVEDVRLAFGSLAPTVRRLRAAEAFLKGRRLDAASAAEAAKLLDADVSPIDDIRSTRDYRLAASRGLLARFLSR
jgi:xanthine dehydrogenase iron-sulfur cluster and FAD-binding subunit A